jgi:hypothetical protein
MLTPRRGKSMPPMHNAKAIYFFGGGRSVVADATKNYRQPTRIGPT